MKTSDLGIQFVQSFEKCRLVAYDDGVGVWTIGWGHTEGVKQGMACTQENADDWFRSDLSVFERAVDRLCHIPASQRQFDALVSFAFNVGIGALTMSTLLRELNARNYLEAAAQFEVWNKGNVNGKLTPIIGLTKRRKAERRIFQDGVYEMHDGPTIDSNAAPDFSDVKSGIV